ncbi:MAG: metalloregulator ArsR/SmtB family transcription factor [Candidatus Brocadiia bacterium]
MAKHAYIALDQVQRLAGALADPTRLRVLNALRGGELCVCQITELAGLAPSTVSRHMSVLSDAGLVKARKDGRWVYYSLPEEPDEVLIGPALEWALRAVERTEQAKEDGRALRKIKQCDRAELCRRQRAS